MSDSQGMGRAMGLASAGVIAIPALDVPQAGLSSRALVVCLLFVLGLLSFAAVRELHQDEQEPDRCRSVLVAESGQVIVTETGKAICLNQ
jgi:hypothetical protein